MEWLPKYTHVQVNTQPEAVSINDLKILTVDQFSSILTLETINHTAPVLLIIAPNDNNIFQFSWMENKYVYEIFQLDYHLQTYF